jgi:hypothetical protein
MSIGGLSIDSKSGIRRQAHTDSALSKCKINRGGKILPPVEGAFQNAVRGACLDLREAIENSQAAIRQLNLRRASAQTLEANFTIRKPQSEMGCLRRSDGIFNCAGSISENSMRWGNFSPDRERIRLCFGYDIDLPQPGHSISFAQGRDANPWLVPAHNAKRAVAVFNRNGTIER